MWDHSPLTAKEKTEITKEWLDAFPVLTKTPSWALLEIVGPFAIGIQLVQKRNKDLYFPNLVFSNLLHPDETISFNFRREFFDDISRYTKPERKKMIFEKMKSNCFLPLGEDLNYELCWNVCMEVLKKEKHYYNLGNLVALQCCLGKSFSEVEQFCSKICSEYKLWAPTHINPLQEAMKLYKEPDELKNAIEESITRFKLSKCNRYEILV
jgi:hypothetical protein